MSSTSDRRTSMSSLRSQASMSNPRLSTDKRRLSTDSTIRTPLPSFPGMSTLPGLSSTSPLVAGRPPSPHTSGRPPSPLTSGRPPSPLMLKTNIPPPTPPKDRLPPPMTPTRKPIQRQKSPLSTEAFSMATPASGTHMPGAFPATPSYGAMDGQEPGAENASGPPRQGGTPDPQSSGKRGGGFRSLITFKALRKNYGDISPNGSPQGKGAGSMGRPSTSLDTRPQTPGADSAFSSMSNRPSLRNKVSGTFWRRKSSLGVMGFGNGATDTAEGGMTNTNPDANDQEMRHGSSGNMSGTTYGEQAGGSDEGGGLRPATPGPENADPIAPTKRRKSGTFWRRKSSLSLANALDGDASTRSDAQDGTDLGRRAVSGPGALGKGNSYSKATGIRNGYRDRDRDETTDGDTAGEEIPIMMIRTPSPPPQIPEFIGGGGGLGVEELLNNIH